MGNALLAKLSYDLRAAAEIRFETYLKDLIRTDDEIIGAVLASSSGELTVRAHKGSCWRPAALAGAPRCTIACCLLQPGAVRLRSLRPPARGSRRPSAQVS